MQLYNQIIDMIAQRPLFGYGASSFKYAYPLFHNPSVPVDLVWESAHSTYLSLWNGLGIVVGTLPILIVLSIFVLMIRSRRPGQPVRSETQAAIGATVLVAIHSTVDFSLEIQGVAMLYTAILALGSARALYAKTNR
jgi:O-antigen ligase